MAREFSRVLDYYNRPLYELQPAPPHFHYEIPITPQNTLQTYEMTAELGPSRTDSGGSMITMPMSQHQHQTPEPMHVQLHNEQTVENIAQYSCANGYGVMSDCESPMNVPATPAMSVASTSSRKRKLSSFGTGSLFDEDLCDDSRSSRTQPDKKQNHSEIEKRRRDKMNTYISELSSIVPMCGAMSRKLDKLTVLRMTVQHMQSVRGAISMSPLPPTTRPTFLSEKELNSLIIQAGEDSFLFVVGCDRGRLVYVSASVKKTLQYDQSELIGQSLFDILHPKDVTTVKDQLSPPNPNPRERFIDARTMMPLKPDVVAGTSKLTTGARRSFFCRIKCKVKPDQSSTVNMRIKDDPEPSSKRKKSYEKKYCVVQCTGYLKSWASVEQSEVDGSVGVGTGDGNEDESSNITCLVAVGRALDDLIAPKSFEQISSAPSRPLQFMSRHTTDGKFMFVEQRVTLALGFLPQELYGTSLYEYVNGSDISAVVRTHKAVLLNREPLKTPIYSARMKNGMLATMQTHFKPIRNPWTKEIESLIANTTVLTRSLIAYPQTDPYTSYDMFNDRSDIEMQRFIDSQVELHKTGSAIAEEVLGLSPVQYAYDMPSDLLNDPVYNHQESPLVGNVMTTEAPDYVYVRNNVPLSAAGTSISPPHTATGLNMINMGTPPPASPPITTTDVDGNGEASMAVIMSLLEAEAGLGGPVNFSGLPWPLP